MNSKNLLERARLNIKQNRHASVLHKEKTKKEEEARDRRKGEELKDKPRSKVCWTGWKSMLIGDEPWFKVRVTVFGRSSGALKAWLWLWPGNDTGNTLTGRFTCRNGKVMINIGEIQRVLDYYIYRSPKVEWTEIYLHYLIRNSHGPRSFGNMIRIPRWVVYRRVSWRSPWMLQCSFTRQGNTSIRIMCYVLLAS